MSNRTDVELLSEFRVGSQAAFAELVKRHVDWVYSAARRRVGDAHLAEDVTQAVFIALARNWRLTEKTIVTSWLFGVVRFTSSNAVRDRTRRLQYESAAAAEKQANPESPGDWNELLPLLEDAVHRLHGGDHQAVLLRFYQRCSFAEVGQALGISEDGARKRVTRAVSKLHRYFTSRGVAVPSAALAGGLLAHCVQPAPSALAATLPAGSTSQAGLSLFRMAARHARQIFLLRMAGCAVIAAVAAIDLICSLRWATAVPTLPVAAVAAVSHAQATQPTSLPSVDPPTFATAITLDQIIAGVKASATQFKNVHVKNFETTLEELPKGETEWIETPIHFAGSAWYDADPLGRKRVYFSDHVMAWEDGAAAYANSIYDLAWDGKEGRQLELATGHSGKMNRMRSAWRSTAAPGLLVWSTKYSTGVGFTVQYMPGEGRAFSFAPDQPLWSALADIRDKHFLKPEIVGQRVNGCDAVRLRIPIDKNSISWWFDPARGFSLVKQQDTVMFPADEPTTEGVDILELKSVAPGIWFPVQASAVFDDVSKPGAYVRYSYRAKEVTVNDSNFDPAIFSVQIPIGWNVYDERTQPRRHYVTMEDGSEQEIHTGTVMPGIRAAPSTRPDGESPPITLSPRAWW